MGRITWAGGVPASRSARSGSVNAGCTITGRRGASVRAISENPSAAPLRSTTSSGVRPCRAAIAAVAAAGSG